MNVPTLPLTTLSSGVLGRQLFVVNYWNLICLLNENKKILPKGEKSSRMSNKNILFSIADPFRKVVTLGFPRT